MRLQKTLSAALGSWMAFGLCGAMRGQDAAEKTLQFSEGRVPAVFQPQADALGRRLLTDEKETTVYNGRLFDSKGDVSAARVTQEAPGQVQLEGFTGESSVLSFDGSRTSGVVSQKSDEALLEVFVTDTVEGMLALLQRGAAVRVLGRGFGPDPRLEPKYRGPRYDIFEVTAPVPCRQDKLVRSRLYYFDTATGLLQSTRYYDRTASPPVLIETRFPAWGKIDGSVYPAAMEHYIGGKLQFTFVAESIEIDSSADRTRVP